MKKRLYRATEIKALDVNALAEAVSDKALVIGIDVAKVDQFAAFVVGSKDVVSTVKWQHPHQTAQLLDLVEQLPCQSVEIVLEPTGTYGDALRYQMGKGGLAVFRVNTKKVHDAREVYDGVPSSHDAKSAAVIAWLHRDQGSELWPIDPDPMRELEAAIGLMTLFDQQHQRNLGNLEALLARHWPEAPELMGLDSVTLLTVLTQLGGPEQIASRSTEAERLMVKTGKVGLSKGKVSALIASSHSTVGLPLLEQELLTLQALAGDTLRARRSSRQAKATVEALSTSTAEVEEMAPVVGKTTAAVLATKIGLPSSFDSARAYEKSAGLNLKERSSGKHRGQLKITKRGSGRARQYLYLAVLRLIQHEPLAAAWYQKKVTRDGGKKPKALVALMRKLVRALWHVAQGQAFDSSKLFDRRRLAVATS